MMRTEQAQQMLLQNSLLRWGQKLLLQEQQPHRHPRHRKQRRQLFCQRLCREQHEWATKKRKERNASLRGRLIRVLSHAFHRRRRLLSRGLCVRCPPMLQQLQLLPLLPLLLS